MSQELIYTSVPRGLKPGSKGFCTVAMSANMPAALVERLESLSGYRPVFPLGDPSADRNPVNGSHWRVTVAGKPRSVLSRVAFAGVDYTQRSNKFAHHLVLEAGEQSSAGPAWMMLQPGVMQSDWPHEPQILSARTLPDGDRSPRPCTAWAALTGDAGWGGVLADGFRTNPEKPFYVIYAPGTQVLPLIEESLSLLPPGLRWQVTFSTYFTELPIGLSCAWRFVVAGSPAAKEAVRMGAGIVDLTRQLGAPPASPLAVAARSGQLPTEANVEEFAANPRTEKRADPLLFTRSHEVATNMTGSSERARKRLGADASTVLEDPTLIGQLGGQRPEYPRNVATRHGVPVAVVVLLVAACLLGGAVLGYSLAIVRDHRPLVIADSSILPPESTAKSSPNDSKRRSPTEHPMRDVATSSPAGGQTTQPSPVQSGDDTIKGSAKPGAENSKNQANNVIAQPAAVAQPQPAPANSMPKPIERAPIELVLSKEENHSTTSVLTDRYACPSGWKIADVHHISLELPKKGDTCGDVLLTPNDNNTNVVIYSSTSALDGQHPRLATIAVVGVKVEITWDRIDPDLRKSAEPVLLGSILILDDGHDQRLKLTFQDVKKLPAVNPDVLRQGQTIPNLPTPALVKCLRIQQTTFTGWQAETQPLQHGDNSEQVIKYTARGQPDFTFNEEFDPKTLTLKCNSDYTFQQLKHLNNDIAKAVKNLRENQQISDNADVEAIGKSIRADKNPENYTNAFGNYKMQWKANSDASSENKRPKPEHDNKAKEELDKLKHFADTLMEPLAREQDMLSNLESEISSFRFAIAYQNGVRVFELPVELPNKK
jgi:hypothetical protein